ncbi:MAG: T9SS type A sorting domain-containing protein [Candidatus Cloacimonetes bacterium]|nr:T9SS type A sorting domain-containing protein [Candidatus Cloacimonadota bacterium]
MRKIDLIIIFLIFTTALFSVIEETESLQNFIYGEAPTSEYDNWMSHIAEGIADPGYNLYAPWDVQSDGFGDYIIPTEGDLNSWGLIIDEFLLENLDEAQNMIDTTSFPYEVVIFNDTDTDRTFYMLREIPNDSHYDDNQTEDPGDDEFGAFDYGWGLYIFYPDGEFPHIVTAPHPNDDYITVPTAHKAFIDISSKFLLISGCGREVVWTNVGNYDNGKSLCDPSRREDHVFNVSYQKFCDLIRDEFDRHEFSLQIHSYDWGNRHWGYPNVQISASYHIGSPDLPIRDHSSMGNDIVNVLDPVVIPANTVGLHAPVNMNEFYGFHCSEYDFNYSNNDTTFAVNTNTDLWGYSTNRQIVYTNSGISNYDNIERFLHLEMDELPNVYSQTSTNYYWFHGWDPVTQTWDMDQRFNNTITYYSPWIDALAEVLPAVYQMDDNEMPVAPTELQVVTECADYITIQWEPGDCFDMNTYQILYSTEPISNGGYSIRDKSNYGRLACLAQDSYTLSGLSPGDHYYFAVRILDKNGNESTLSNEVLGIAGPAVIDDFICYGRDEYINLEWEASAAGGYSGFNIYKKTSESEYEVLDTWLINPELVGIIGNNVPYFYIDTDVENGQIYTYKLCFEYNDLEYVFGDEPSAVSQKIYEIYAAQLTGTFSDTCYFGYNEFASNGYDANFEIAADDSLIGDYFFCQFYEQYWNNVPNNYEQEIYGAYNTEEQLKSWIYRVRTNQLNLPVEIGIANLDRNAERFYLYASGQYIDLSTSNYIFTPSTANYYTFTLYYGNLTPSLDFDDIPNQLFYPNEILEISWSLNLSTTIDHINIYAENDEITIPIETELYPTISSVEWVVPQLLFEDLSCRIDLVMDEGDTLHHFSPYSFGIISPQNIVETYQGWNLMTKNFNTNQYSTEEIFGENVEFYEFIDNEFNLVDEPEFLNPYWNYAPQDNYFALSNVTMQKTAYSMQMSSGWNIIPNPHRAHYDLDQLVFSVNNVDYEYYQAVQNRLIEPAVFEFDNSFDPVYELASANAYYLYCYEDNVILKFIPYYSNEFSPEYEFNWKTRINVEQENNDISSVIVGTSNVADSLYNANYDLLKPLAKPFEDVITFSIPMEIDEVTQKLHQSITSPLDETITYIYSWNAELQLAGLQPLFFNANSFELPENARIFIEMPERYLEIPENGFVEYVPADTLLEITILITDQDYSNVDDIIATNTFSLQNYPNPFNPETNINYSIPEEGKVELSIYNIKGQKVKTLVNETQVSGEHTVVWNGTNKQNKHVASGVYFYKLEINDSKLLINKMLLLK